MAISSTRIHMICGVCGNKDYMSYTVENEPDDDVEDQINTHVRIKCNNCGSLTWLEEIIKPD